MVASLATLREYRASIQIAKEQPYVYAYRMKLSLLKHRPMRRLLRLYINHALTATQKRVDVMDNRGGLNMETIMADPSLKCSHYSLLYALCRLLKPRIVIETGVGLGASSAFILQALQDNNRNNRDDGGCGADGLFSVDLPCSFYQSDAGIPIDEAAYTSHHDTPGCLIPENLRDRWTLILGKSMDQLPRLCQRLGTVDFFFHDSEHTYQNMIWEYRTVWPRIRLGGALASHDVDWNSAFADFAQANNLEPSIPVDGFGLITR
jgi:predicted O-methyltransferase YrrM